MFDLPSCKSFTPKSIGKVEPELKKGENIAVIDRDGRSLLTLAVIEKQYEVVELLLTTNMDMDHQDSLGFTPLHYAAQDGQEKLVRLLVESGATVDSIDHHGNTPLFKAVFNSFGKGEVITYLLSKGADKNLKNNHGVSPLELAKRIANYDIEQFLT